MSRKTLRFLTALKILRYTPHPPNNPLSTLDINGISLYILVPLERFGSFISSPRIATFLCVTRPCLQALLSLFALSLDFRPRSAFFCSIPQTCASLFCPLSCDVLTFAISCLVWQPSVFNYVEKVVKNKKKRVAPVSVDEQPARKRIAEITNLSTGAQDANIVLGKKTTKETPTNEIAAVGTVVGAGQTGVVSVGLIGIVGGSGGVAASKKKRKKKEVIDYSATQTENENPGVPGSAVVGGGDNADPKSKVRSWLLASQCRVERSSSSGLPKSKSTPVGLTSTRVPGSRGVVGAAGRVRQVTLRRLTDPKARSAGSLTRNDVKNDRVRLQVVYKPPFKFSVKLRKADKVGQMPGNHGPPTNRNNTQMPRTGVLVRTNACKKSKERVRTNHGKQIIIPGNGRSNSAIIQEPANSDVHTVPSDLEVLLSESEFLFSDAWPRRAKSVFALLGRWAIPQETLNSSFFRSPLFSKYMTKSLGKIFINWTTSMRQCSRRLEWLFERVQPIRWEIVQLVFRDSVYIILSHEDRTLIRFLFVFHRQNHPVSL